MTNMNETIVVILLSILIAATVAIFVVLFWIVQILAKFNNNVVTVSNDIILAIKRPRYK